MSQSKFSGDEGSVTAEFMILIPWLLGLVALALGMFRIGILQIEATATAHQISRLAARADSLEVPMEFQETAWDVDLVQEPGLICALVTEASLDWVEARACAPSLGR
jgi:hypothetical protein